LSAGSLARTVLSFRVCHRLCDAPKPVKVSKTLELSAATSFTVALYQTPPWSMPCTFRPRVALRWPMGSPGRMAPLLGGDPVGVVFRPEDLTGCPSENSPHPSVLVGGVRQRRSCALG
jgi:hypothetical protein